jgi:serine/threonine-protein kinase RsbW
VCTEGVLSVTVTSIQANVAYTLCFDSTLYTSPILDLLLANVPVEWHFDLRLGLQEALINAVKHGNQLDRSRKVTIEFFTAAESYHWVVKDQGLEVQSLPESQVLCCESSECGRGIFIMHQVFDYVHWNQYERKLHLFKQMHAPVAKTNSSLANTQMAMAY